MARADKINAIRTNTASGKARFLKAAEKVQDERAHLAREISDREESTNSPPGYVHISERLKAPAKELPEQWAAEIKSPSKTLQQCVALLKEPYNPTEGEQCGGEPGRFYVVCSKDKAGELAARIHKLICTPALKGMARAVRTGESPPEKRRREESVKRARVISRAKIPNDAPTADCPSAERFQNLAVGIETLPPPRTPMRSIRHKFGNWGI